MAGRAWPGAREQPPNLLVFLVDDLGWQDVSLPLHTHATEFNERYRTPHLEQLAAEGLVFTQAYASAPVCTPTRTSLMTGSSPARSHITYWILHEGQDTSAAWDGLQPPAWELNGLQPGAVTLPGLLREAGYRTIHVGKAHLGAKGTPGEDPVALGFDVNIAGHGAGAPASYLGSESYSRGTVWDVPGLADWHGQDVFLTDALAVEAGRAVRDAVAAEKPFFLHMAPYAVHTPISANDARVGAYSHLPAREAAYASMIETVDAALGSLMQTLDDLGVRDNTLVVFTSDNGGLSAHGRDGPAHTHNAPLRSGKGSAYEGGLRVPAVMTWPGQIAAAGRTDVPIVTHDLFPTLLAAAGVALPQTHAPAVDGQDLRPVFAAQGQLEERDLLWHQPHYWGVAGPGIQPFSALRSGEWKIIFWHATGQLELYNLAEDVGEQRNLADSEPERLKMLAGRLGAALREAGAQPSRNAHSGVVVPWPDA